jgi:hypothetical protein
MLLPLLCGSIFPARTYVAVDNGRGKEGHAGHALSPQFRSASGCASEYLQSSGRAPGPPYRSFGGLLAPIHSILNPFGNIPDRAPHVAADSIAENP